VLRERIIQGSTVDRIPLRNMGEFPIVLPPREEQEQIVRVLGALDDKIDSNRRLAELLEKVAAALFHARFVEFIGIEAFEQTEMGLLPSGCAPTSLSELVEITMGQSPPGTSYSDDPNAGVPLVQGMGAFGRRYPTTNLYTSAPARRIRAGATLMTVRAPVGAVNVADTDLCIGRGVAGIESNYPAFTEFLIRSLKGRWASEESGTIFPAVNRQQITELRVPRPPLDAIAEFEQSVTPAVAMLRMLHKESRSLKALHKLALPKLVTGEIRVLDASIAAVEALEPASDVRTAEPI
jgi:type I restriction enzyme S subunit